MPRILLRQYYKVLSFPTDETFVHMSIEPAENIYSTLLYDILKIISQRGKILQDGLYRQLQTTLIA
jgi:hypothetical protein